MKKVLLVAILILLSVNSAFAATWITVNANNGKSALLDTDNLEILDNHYVKYWIKSNINGFTYRYFMMSDYSSNTSCILETYKYDKNGQLLDSSENAAVLTEIIPDSLNEAIYKKVKEIVKTNPLSIEQTTWINYFSTIQKQYEKMWKPENDKTQSRILKNKVLFVINKRGEILSKEVTEKSDNAKFDKSIEEALSKISGFSTISFDYDGKISFILEFEYYLKGDKTEAVIKMGNDGVGIIPISKEKTNVGKCILSGVGTILVIPFAILGTLLEM